MPKYTFVPVDFEDMNFVDQMLVVGAGRKCLDGHILETMNVNVSKRCPKCDQNISITSICPSEIGTTA